MVTCHLEEMFRVKLIPVVVAVKGQQKGEGRGGEEGREMTINESAKVNVP